MPNVDVIGTMLGAAPLLRDRILERMPNDWQFGVIVAESDAVMNSISSGSTSPGFFVSYRSQSIADQPNSGNHYLINQSWIITVLIRSYSATIEAEQALEQAGVLMMGIDRALLGYKLGQYYSTIRAESPPEALYRPGVALFPLQYAVRFRISRDNT